MASIVLTASTADDTVTCVDNTYSVARSGAGTLGLLGSTSTILSFGQLYQAPDYTCRELLLEFDFYAGLIALGFTTLQIANASISSAILSTTTAAGNQPDSTFTGRARAYDYGGAITTADFVAGADITAKTLLAHAVFANADAGDTPRNWTDDAFATNVSKTATPTRIGLFSKAMEDNTTPTDIQRVGIYTANAATSGYRPLLTVTYEMQSGGFLMASD